MTVMLQNKIKRSAIAVLAFAALAGHASADSSCNLADGYAMDPAAFTNEAEACLEGVNGINVDTWLESEVRRQTQETRSTSNMTDLENLASLNEAARLHAMDMVARKYAAHQDPEGRDHLDRVRILDRQRLIGASGANLAVLPASATPEDAFAALVSDKNNAANLTREAFTHMGIGAATDGEQLYVVQLFARVDGQLKKALPMVLATKTDLSATYAEAGFTPVGWHLEDSSGKRVASGSNERLSAQTGTQDLSKLSIDIAYGNDIYTLKGPIVSLQ